MQYRHVLAAALRRLGHEVSSADSGRSAIDLAVRIQPEVAIVDWMLRDDLNGLHVVNVLQALDPAVRTVLVSGFASPDLAHEAEKIGVDRFLEKPFDLEQLIEAIDPEQEVATRRPMIFAVVCAQTDGDIVSANDAAVRLLRNATGTEVKSLARIFDEHTIEKIMGSRHQWTDVSAPDGKRWSVRVRPWEDGRLIVILGPGQGELRRRSLVRLLLDIHVAAGTRWPYAHRVLVVDDSRVARETSTRMLERAGCVVYGAGDHTLAVRLMRADHGIGVVLLDYELPDDNTAAIAAELEAVRPHVRIVGTSGRDHRADFAKLGVTRYIQKPWTIDDLIDAVRDPGSS